MVDVAENLEQLVKGNAPHASCPTCKSLLVAAPTPDQIMFLRSLPARDRDAALDRFLDKAQRESPDKLEDCLAKQSRKAVASRAPASRGLYIALGVCALLIGGLAVAAFELWQRNETIQVVARQPIVTTPPGPTFTRPDWIMFDVPGAAYCHDMINRLMCVGVSSYRTTRDDAVTEANDAALEELVNAVGLKVTNPVFRDATPGFSDARAKALAAVQAADLNRAGKAYADAATVVRNARRRVVEIFQASGGPAVPSQRSDWYWEEYAGDKGQANEVLVFVRYDVPIDAVRALVEKYSTTSSVVGTNAMTAFPALAWEHTDFTGGAVITKASRLLELSGVLPQHIVMAIGEHRVADAPGFARRLGEALRATDPIQLTVKDGEATSRVDLKR